VHPVLFELGPVTIYTYGVLVAAGALIWLWYARRQARRAGLDAHRVWDLGIYTVLAALVVAKLWLLLSDWKYYAANPGDVLSLATLQSGGTFYGGVLGAVLAIAVYAYTHSLPLLPILDSFAAALPLGHAIGRLGCFAAGCCYGKPTTLPWGVRFTDEAAARLAGTPLGTALHPTQLYEAAAEFLNFLFLAWLGTRERFRGQTLGTYMILYGMERASIEFFRGDPGRTLMFGGAVSLMQVVSVGLVVTGAILWSGGLRRMGSSHSTSPAPAGAGPRAT
jgi:phosphatidylglycerol:prolipoprotein diacylglycerol transferase